MAFIHLQLIGQLATKSEFGKQLAFSQCYNADSRESRIDGETFMRLIKINKQAKNLYRQLKQLHQVCTDFAAGNFQPYIDKYNQDADDTYPPYDPLDEIRNIIVGIQSVDDLPPRIEQYRELVDYAASFSRFESKKREGFRMVFGNLPVLATADAEQEIQEINVEYCLDKYNDFYHACRVLIEAHANNAGYETEQQCAQGLAKELVGYFN